MGYNIELILPQNQKRETSVYFMHLVNMYLPDEVFFSAGGPSF